MEKIKLETCEKKFLDVVIPVYRAEKILPELCSRMAKEFKNIPGKCRLILVEDCGPDDSWKVIEDLSDKYKFIKGLKLSRNFGQHYAITAGLEHAEADWVVVMDCDLQDAPEDISRLLECALKNDYDIVIAQQIKRKHSILKGLFSKFYYKVFEICSGMKLNSTVGNLRIIRGKVVKAFCDMHEVHRLFGGMIQWLGFKVGFLQVEHQERFEGESSYNILKLLKLGFDGIFSFSNRPLYISILTGTFVSILAVVIGLIFLIKHLFIAEIPVPGWTTLILLISFFSGLILINIGILAMYIGRVYDQVKGRPLYVVDKKTNEIN